MLIRMRATAHRPAPAPKEGVLRTRSIAAPETTRPWPTAKTRNPEATRSWPARKNAMVSRALAATNASPSTPQARPRRESDGANRPGESEDAAQGQTKRCRYPYRFRQAVLSSLAIVMRSDLSRFCRTARAYTSAKGVPARSSASVAIAC